MERMTSWSIGLIMFLVSTPALAGVANTKHNLSAAGPGTFKATSEQTVCVFCHTPHNANPSAPLWNHELSGQTYTPYSSSTAVAAPGQPTGTSRLCLSCHDGTVALGSIHNMPRTSSGSGTVTGLESAMTGQPVVGTDLSDDHPVSFNYDTVATQNGEIRDRASVAGNLRFGAGGEMQCASCHDPHTDANPKFLRLGFTEAGYGSPLCRECHVKDYWGTVANQSHRESLSQWNGSAPNPWHVPGHDLANDPSSTPKANGCESCHKPHGGGGRVLLKTYPGTSYENLGESQTCLACHNGNVATLNRNIDAALDKLYAHPVKDPTRAGRHNPQRQGDGTVREDATALNDRHAECNDCHNPHAVSPGVSPSVSEATPTSNLASNVLKGIWGVSPTWPSNWGLVTSYTEVPEVQYQHELCFKCHSYYAFGTNPPLDPYGQMGGDGRLTDQAQEFNPNNASYHPVVAAGKNDFKMTVNGTTYDYSSSLLNGLTPSSTFTCAECHSDSEGVNGLKGPHGSDVWPILWAPYDFTTGTRGTDTHLCFKCHDPDVYGVTGVDMGPETTGFSGTSGGGGGGQWRNLHFRHVELRDMPCLACHSAVPHGWKRRALLVFGTGVPDPAPYNAHERFPINGSSAYGLNSATPIDSIQSGTWQRSDCHGPGVGSCSGGGGGGGGGFGGGG